MAKEFVRETETTHEIASTRKFVLRDVQRLLGAERESCGMVAFKVTEKGLLHLRVVSRAWNVSISALVRIALHEMLERYNFSSGGLLITKDKLAINRHPLSKRPLISAKEAEGLHGGSRFGKRRAHAPRP